MHVLRLLASRVHLALREKYTDGLEATLHEKDFHRYLTTYTLFKPTLSMSVYDIHVHVHIYIYTYIYTHTHTYTYIHLLIHTYAYIHIKTPPTAKYIVEPNPLTYYNHNNDQHMGGPVHCRDQLRAHRQTTRATVLFQTCLQVSTSTLPLPLPLLYWSYTLIHLYTYTLIY
jgi:hypothetical protein